MPLPLLDLAAVTALSVLANGVAAQGQTMRAGALKLIPTPRSCVRHGGAFTIGPGTVIALPSGADDDDPASLLQDAQVRASSAAISVISTCRSESAAANGRLAKSIVCR